jgi:probable HAF family extracellular repeat protein
MKSRIWMWITVVYWFTALAIPVGMSAQDNPSPTHKHHQYKLIDIGTLGGPASYYSAAGLGSQVLNDRETVTGYGDTPLPDPYSPNCWDEDCFLGRAFRWQNGVLTDLGALPGGSNSAVSGINARGWIAGFSQNGVIDPVTTLPAIRAVLWKQHKTIDLGTLGGYLSNGVYVNDGGQVVGFATFDAIPDPFSPFGASVHTFLWENGVMRDVGTLGGPDSLPSAGGINQRNGLVAGLSYINSIPNPGTGIPTVDPFLWNNGAMTDLGTLGGTIGSASLANNQGQVIGVSDLAGDLTSHPFLWTRRHGQGVLTDLGTLGGDNGTANWLNDAGAVVGRADLPGSQTFGAFLWQHGVMKDLGRVGSDPCSNARAINSSGQIVGSTSDCSYPLHAFLWEQGGPMVDLNGLVQSNSGFQVLIAYNINDRGEIAGTGVPAGCDNIDTCGHVFLMIPCDDNHPGQCADNSMIEVASPQTSTPTVVRPAAGKQGSESPVRPIDQLRNRLVPLEH